MRIGIRLGVVLGLALACLAISGAVAKAQTKSEGEKKYERLIYSVKGPDLFRAHCAPCHGLDAKGDGPVAASLKSKPADLTVLARSSGGVFPVARVRKVISGDEVTAAHGSREMPIWGSIFHQIEEDQDFGNVRLQNLVKYLQSIQQK